MNKRNAFWFIKQAFCKRVWVKLSIITVMFGLIVAFLYLPQKLASFVSSTRRSITLYTPREVFSAEKIKEFERLTGIRVKITYFNTNEEMFAKFKINRGAGYDIVVPSDYMVELLVKEKLLLPLDHSKISNFPHLDRRLMNKFYDRENKFSLPVCWIPYGIGFNRAFFDFDNNTSWDVVFDKEVLKKYGDHKISMLDDTKEAVLIAAIYLFGRVENLTSNELEKVKDLLMKQKSMVEAYSEAGAKYLLMSNIVPLAVIPAGRIKEMEDLEHYGFVIPKEGSLVDIMNVAIPATSKKSELAHEFIDFLVSAETSACAFNEISCNPSNTKAYSLVDPKYGENKAFFPDDETFERLFIINNQIDPQVLEKLWFLIKSA